MSFSKHFPCAYVLVDNKQVNMFSGCEEYEQLEFLDMSRREQDNFIHLPINCQILNLLTVGIV